MDPIIYYRLQCDYKTFFVRNLKRHIKFHHDKIYDHVCQICDYKAYSKSNLRTHVKTVHEKKKSECEQCGEMVLYLGNHKRIVHDLILFQCDMCNFTANSKARLVNHKKLVHEGKRYQCDSCDASYTEKTPLKNHKERKHGNVIRYPCSYSECQKSFPSPDYLRNHIKRLHMHVVDNGRRYECMLCEFKAKQSGNLKRHMANKHQVNIQKELKKN